MPAAGAPSLRVATQVAQVHPELAEGLNGYVEQTQGTHRYEFYEAYELPWTVGELRPLLRRWEWTYNFVRPHQALDNRTPAEYLRLRHPEATPRLASVSHVVNWDRAWV